MPFHPKVEKRGISLELGGMAKTLEFRALQRVSRSREKKVWRSHYGTANGREVRGKVYTIDGAGGAALEPALELPCRSDSTIGKGHERCSARPRRGDCGGEAGCEVVYGRERGHQDIWTRKKYRSKDRPLQEKRVADAQD